MRRYVSISLSLLVAGLFSVVRQAHAVPSTAGGPAGYGTTDGTSNLTVWLRAEDLGGGPVSSWTDQSGYGNDAAQSDTDRQPGFLTNELNSTLPALTFDGGNATGTLRDRLEIPDAASLRPTGMSLFVVARSRDTDYGAYFSKFSNGGWNDGWGINEETGAPGALQMWGTNTTPGGALAHTLNTYGVFSATHDDPNSVRRVWARGTAGPNDTTIDPIGYTTPAAPSLIGHNPGSDAYHLTGEIAEIIFSDTPVNDPQRQIITNYLSSKYNLPLDTEDRYDGDTSLNGHHDFDVFGIGSDGTNSVTSAGSEGFGIEATGGSLDTDEWVLAGHKVETNGLTFANISAAGVTQRWERAWYLGKTGDVDATLAFDFSDAGLTLPAEASNFTLLYRANERGDFTSAGSFLQSGDLLTIDLASINLPDGIYTVGFFTPPIPEPSSFLLLGLGCCGLMFGRRRRKAAKEFRNAVEVAEITSFDRNWSKTTMTLLTSTLAMMLVFAAAPSAHAMLVGYWDFNDGGGTTAVDSASTNDGILSGSAAFTGSGKLSGAVSFTGGQVAIPSAAVSALDSDDDFSVSLWINPSAFGSYKTVFDTASRHVSLWINTATDGFIGAGGSSAGITYTPDAFTLSQWQHVVVTYSGSSPVNIFRNGTANGSAATGGTTFTQQWIIGGNPSGGGSAYAGSIDDVGLYDRVLTGGEIAAISNLANEIELAYDLGQTNQLFDLFTAGSGSVKFGTITWTPASGFGGAAGDVTAVGEGFFLNLDGVNGVLGVPLIPEPSSLALLGLGLIGLANRTRRRRIKFGS